MKGVTKASPQPQLPPGWALYYDAQRRPFYWNSNTKQSSWSVPPWPNRGAPVQFARGPPAPNSGLKFSATNYGANFQPTFTDVPSQSFPPPASSLQTSGAQQTQTSNPRANNNNYPAQNSAQNYPTQNSAQNYPSQNSAQNYPSQNSAQNYPSQNSAQNYPSQISNQPLPHGWQQAYDRQTGRTYFINHNEKKTSWEDPRLFAAQSPPSSISPHSHSPSNSGNSQFNPQLNSSQMNNSQFNPQMNSSQINSSQFNPQMNSSQMNSSQFNPQMNSSQMNSSQFNPQFNLQPQNAQLNPQLSNVNISQPNFAQSNPRRGSSNPPQVAKLCNTQPKRDLQSNDQKICEICQQEFTFFKRRHHCRCCFRELCGNCTTKNSPVPQFSHREPVRVCDCCFGHLQRNSTSCMAKLVEYLEPDNAKLKEAILELIEIFNQEAPRESSKMNETEGVFGDFITLGIFSKIMTLLSSNQPSGEVCLALLQLIAVITTNPKINLTLSELGVSESLLSLRNTSKFEISSPMRTEILAILARQSDLEYGRAAIKDHGLSFLIETLGGSSDARQIELASVALRNLCEEPDTAALICKNGLPAIIFTLLSDSHRVLQINTEIINKLSQTSELRQIIQDAGTLSSLLVLLKNPASQQNISIQRTALEIFLTFSKASEAECQMITQTEGSLEYFRDMFSPKTDQLSFQMVLEIINNVLQHPSLQSNVISAIANCSNGLIDLITTYEKEPGLQGRVLQLTGTVLIADPQAKINFVKLDLIQKLLYVISKQNENQEYATKTLSNLLHDNVSNSNQFIDLGGPTLITQLIPSPQAQIAKASCELMANLFVVNPKSIESFSASKLIQDVFKILPRSDTPLQEAITKMLSSFFRNPNTIQYLVPASSDKSMIRSALSYFPELLISNSVALQTYTLEIIGFLTSGPRNEDPVRDCFGELGVAPLIISILSSEHSQVQKAAAFAFSHFVRSQSNQQAISQVGGIEPLLTLMKPDSVIKNEDIKIWISQINATLSGNEKLREEMLRSGALEIAIEALWTNITAVQLNATITISNFAMDDNQDLKDIHEKGGIAAVVSMLDTTDEHLQGTALVCLSYLAKRPAHKQNIIQGGALPSLLKILENATQPETFSKCVWLFSILSYDPNVSVFMETQTECWPHFLKLYDQDANSKKQATLILMNLCENSQKNWLSIVEIGGLSLVLKLLESDSTLAHTKSCGYIAQETQNSEKFRNEFVEKDGVVILLRLLQENPMQLMMVSHILQILERLSSLPKAQSTLLERTPLLTQYIKPDKSSQDILACLKIFQNICGARKETENQFLSNYCQLIPDFLGIIYNNQMNQELCVIITNILQKLSSFEKNIQSLHEQGTTLALVTLLSTKHEPLLENITLTLSNLVCGSDKAKQTLIESRGLESIVLLLHSSNSSIASHALFLVSLLSTSKNFCDSIVPMEGGVKLLSLLKNDPQVDAIRKTLTTLNNFANHSIKGRSQLLAADGLALLLSLLEMKELTPDQTHETFIEEMKMNQNKQDPHNDKSSSEGQHNDQSSPAKGKPEINLDQPLLTFGNTTLSYRHVKTLEPKGWLDDQVLNFFYEYMEQFMYPNAPIAFIGPTIAYAWRQNKGPVQDWAPIYLDPLNLKEKELVCIIINDNENFQAAFGGSHWSLLIWRKSNKKFEHYDSAIQANYSIAVKTAALLAPYFEIQTEDPIAIECPRQSNSYDCGLWALGFTEYVAKQFFTPQTQLNNTVTEEAISKKRTTLKQLIFQLAQEIHPNRPNLFENTISQIQNPGPQRSQIENPSSQGSQIENPSSQGSQIENPSSQGSQIENPSSQGSHSGIRVVDEYQNPDQLLDTSNFKEQLPSGIGKSDNEGYQDAIQILEPPKAESEPQDNLSDSYSTSPRENSDNYLNNNNNLKEDNHDVKTPLNPHNEFHQPEFRNLILEIIASLSHMDESKKQLGKCDRFIILLEGLIDIPDEVLPKLCLQILTNISTFAENRQILSEQHYHNYLLQTLIQLVNNKLYGLSALRLIDSLLAYGPNHSTFGQLGLVDALVQGLQSGFNDIQLHALYTLRHLDKIDPASVAFIKANGLNLVLNLFQTSQNELILFEIFRLLCFLALFPENRPALQNCFPPSFLDGFETRRPNPLLLEQARKLLSLLY